MPAPRALDAANLDTWKRTYWAVWWANFITSIGMMSFLPFFPSILERLGIQDRSEIATWAGILYGAAPLSAAIMSPVWGSIGDRYGRRAMLLRSLFAIGVFVGAMAFATSPWQLFVLRILQGVFSGFAAPSITLVSIAAPPGEQGRATGSLQTAMAAGAAIGPFLGGLLGPRIGTAALFLCVAGLSIVSALLVIAWAREDASLRRAHAGRSLAGHALRGTWEDLGTCFRHPTLRAALLVVFCIQLGLGATTPILELFVRELEPGSEAHQQFLNSLLFGGMAALNLWAMPIWGRQGDRMGHERALFLVAVLSSVALLLHAAASVFVVLLAARLLLGAASAGGGPCAFGLAAVEVGVDRRGGAIGIVFGARTLAVAIAAMLGGWLSNHIGIRGLFAAGAGSVLVAAFVLRRATQRRAIARSVDGG